MHQYSQGIHTTQGHKGIPENHYEEEHGRSGFFGPVSHLIKPDPSTRWENIEGPLRPHLYDIVEVPKDHGHFKRLIYNNDVEISNYWVAANTKTTESFRNGDADTIYFVHQGAGVFLTEYGLLEYRKGSYVVVPKSLHHAIAASAETQFLVIESKNSMFREPDRGVLGRNGLYDLASLGRPDLEKMHAYKKTNAVDVRKVRIKKYGEYTTFTYGGDVFDTVGWKGDYFPFTLHIDNIMPVMSHRVHLPPSVHSTFISQNFVVCTFLPRPVESDPDALKVPFFHQNIDYDEVLFYHDGNFFSRDNLHAGMITLHPAGFPHGPHPKAFQNIGKKAFLDEVAVMIDAKNQLFVDQTCEKVEVTEYWKSWMKK